MMDWPVARVPYVEQIQLGRQAGLVQARQELVEKLLSICAEGGLQDQLRTV